MSAPGRSPLRERPGYRPEIEGLRAVAALLVAIFHIWLGRVSGGVDVFFVVAGFLITTTLIGQLKTYDRVRPFIFLRRLASRLLPAALTVIVVTLVLAVLWLPTAFWIQTFREALAASLYFENWQLAFDATDYLALDVFHSPVQHFWAMSVQGQFYILWLALFAVIGLLALRFRNHRTRLIVLGLSVVVAVSLAYSIVATAADQTFTYYNTFARAWEFGLGGLAAMALPRLNLSATVRAILGWVGLAGVISCGLVLQVSTLFPGWVALWPTLSALFVLAGGSAGVPATAGRLLASRPMVWLGGLSYGIYLWHWPLLVFYLEWKNGDRPSLGWGSGIILLAVLLAWLTKKLIEDPVAGWSRSPRTPVRTLATTGMIAGIAAVALASTALIGVGQQRTEQELAFARSIAAGAMDCVGAASLVDPGGCLGSESLDDPIPADPIADYSAPYDLCRTDEIGTDIRECSYGPTDAEVRVVLIGNSHAVSWFPALQAIAEQKNWRLDVFFKSQCAFNTTLRDADGELEEQSCLAWGEKLRRTLDDRPAYDYMLTSYATGASFRDSTGAVSDEAGVAGFREAWAPLLARGTKVWAMLDTPHLSDETFECYEENLADLDPCGTPARDDAFRQDLLVPATSGLDGARLVDMSDYFCSATECPLQIGDVFVYRDTDHFTATYSLSLAPYLERELGLVETEGLAFASKAYVRVL